MPPPYRYLGGEIASPNNIQVVESASDLSGDLHSNVAYYISGTIDMGDQQITVPQGGLTLSGSGFNVSKLISSSANYTLFIDDGVYSGDLFLDFMTCEITGTNSKVFDLDNNANGSAVEMNSVNFDNCTSIGSLNRYRQVLARNIAFFAPEDGIEFVGAWSGGVAIVDSILINVPAGVTAFKAGSGFLVGSSFRSNMNAISIDDTATVFDFTSSNFTPDGSFLLDDFRTNPSAGAIPNILASDPKCKFVSCIGVANTYPGGDFTVSTSATTTISTVDTLVKMAGTTTYNDMQWFTSSTDNAFICNSTVGIDVNVDGVLSFSGSNNNEMGLQIRKWDDSASSYVNVGPEFVATLNGGGGSTRAENLSFQGTTSLDKDDRIEIWVKNLSGTNNITTTLGGEVRVSERAS